MRDEFSQKTKEVLERRARGRCSNPECRQDTSGPHTDPEKAINTGEAAHITAAASGGPRYDSTLTPKQRRAAANGIWLCGTCAKLIDSDLQKYTVELLRQWRQIAEAGDARGALPVSAPSGLPRAVPFVGRAETLAGLLTTLRTGGAGGVFALGGMGGVGKTALAAEIVARLAEEPQTFPGGAAWVACEDLHGSEGLAEAWMHVARALATSEVAALPDAAQQRGALHGLLAQGTRRLLALDNVDDLEAGPLLEALAIQGHTVLLLTARQTIDLPGLLAISLDVLSEADAQALFAETLRRSSPSPSVPKDEVLIPDLVAALGRLPLALELTATYTGRLGLALSTVYEEVRRDGIEAAPFLPAQHAQQRALVLRFDRSWQALAETPQRQRLFASLSLLASDSFPRTAALALAKAAGGEQATEVSAATDLAALVDYALVEVLSGERYRLHPLLRLYAAKRLAIDTAAIQTRLGEAMVAFWRAFAEAHHDDEDLDALETNASGLLGALAWAQEHARSQEVLELARALSRFWYVRWRIDDARRARPWALEAARALGNKEAERWATHELAVLNAQTGRVAEARAGFEQMLELARQLGDLAAEREELHELAVLNAQTGRDAEARAGHKQALSLARQLGDVNAERQEIHALTLLDAQAGRDAEARAGYEQALDLARQRSDSPGEALELQSLGSFIGQRGEPERGRELVEQSLAISKQQGNVYEIGHCHQHLAWIEEHLSNWAATIVHYQEALRCFEQVQAPEAEEVREALRALGEES